MGYSSIAEPFGSFVVISTSRTNIPPRPILRATARLKPLTRRLWMDWRKDWRAWRVGEPTSCPMFCVDMAKWVRPVWPDPFNLQPVWPTTRLTRLKMTRDPIDLTRTQPDLLVLPRLRQHWVDWDWGVIFIKYLLILLYLICYALHYSLSFFTCRFHFLFLL